MSHRYDRTGERIEEDEPTGPAGPETVRDALRRAQASRPLCPVCSGLVRPGWTAHPSCAKTAP